MQTLSENTSARSRKFLALPWIVFVCAAAQSQPPSSISSPSHHHTDFTLTQNTRRIPSCRGTIVGGNHYLDSRNNGPVRPYLDINDSALDQNFTPDSTFNRVLVIMQSPILRTLPPEARVQVGFKLGQSGSPRYFLLEATDLAPSGYRIAAGLEPDADVARQNWRVRFIEISLHIEGRPEPICRSTLRISGES